MKRTEPAVRIHIFNIAQNHPTSDLQPRMSLEALLRRSHTYSDPAQHAVPRQHDPPGQGLRQATGAKRQRQRPANGRDRAGRRQRAPRRRTGGAKPRPLKHPRKGRRPQGHAADPKKQPRFQDRSEIGISWQTAKIIPTGVGEGFGPPNASGPRPKSSGRSSSATADTSPASRPPRMRWRRAATLSPPDEYGRRWGHRSSATGTRFCAHGN